MGKYTRNVLTDIAWGPTRCGHHVSFAFHFGQSKVADHDFGLLILTVVQQVLRLERKVEKKFINYVDSWVNCGSLTNSPKLKDSGRTDLSFRHSKFLQKRSV